MGNPLLTVKNLSAWYDRGKMVLDGFSLELAAHECPVANSLHPDLKQTVIFHFGK